MQLTASMRLPHLSLGLKKGCSLQFQAVALIEISRLTEKMLPPLVTLARVVALVVLFRSALWLLEHRAYWGGSSWIWIPRKKIPTRSHEVPLRTLERRPQPEFQELCARLRLVESLREGSEFSSASIHPSPWGDIGVRHIDLSLGPIHPDFLTCLDWSDQLE